MKNTPNKPELRHFRLASGDEIVCELVSSYEDEVDDFGYGELIVRNVMQISTSEKSATEQYYVFKPWMHYLEGPNDLMTIYSDHIIAVSEPKKTLAYCYDGAVHEMHKAAEIRDRMFDAEENEKMGKVVDKILDILDENENDDADIEVKKTTNIVNLFDSNDNKKPH